MGKNTVIHEISGLDPNIWTIRERCHIFTPLLQGKNLMTQHGRGVRVATFQSLKEAQEAVFEFIGRMQ